MADRSPSRLTRTIAAGVTGIALLAGCSSIQDAVTADAPATGDAIVYNSDVELFDSSVVHDIEVSFDDADYDELIASYESAGDKEWIEATVVIDGTTFDDVGLRLKGNSSLFGLSSATAGNPEDLPWLIRLDKYVDEQDYQGHTDVVIRSSSTETALNEAVAQELLDLAGLANQDPIATTFTVNGGDTELRLAVEHPDDDWDDANFDNDDGVLYKADSEGDYSYRGDDAESYVDVFDQKAGDDDLEPLVSFLEFINNTDDATFNAELGEQLDVDAFATYLAFQELIGNSDDIDGRGNNSYLHYDYGTEEFTVVNWDLNLAFGTANVGGGGPQAGVGPQAAGVPRGAGGGAAGGPGGQSNVLVERFMADDDFAVLYESKLVELQATLFDSGAAEDLLAGWTDLLSAEADELVDSATLQDEATAIASYVAARS